MIWLFAGALGFVLAAWAGNKAKKALKGVKVRSPVVKEAVGSTAAVEDKEKKEKKKGD